jgi:phage terminase small subunit
MAQLTDMQEKFCEEYLVDLNMTQAAVRAGYSPAAAAAQASKLVDKPQVQERIQELKAARSQKTSIDAEWVLRECVESYHYNKARVVDRWGNEVMRNASQAAKFLELAGRHIGVRAFDPKVEPEAEKSLSELTLDQLIHLRTTLEQYGVIEVK